MQKKNCLPLCVYLHSKAVPVVSVYWVKADVPCGNLYWQIVMVDSIAVTVPVKFLHNQRHMQDYKNLYV